MNLFFWRKKNQGPAPEWTSFSDESEFEEFIAHVRNYFDKKNLSYTVDNDAIIVKDPGWPFNQMGLSNLAQMCKQNPRRRWKSIINDHFATMLENKKFEQEFYAKAHDYSYASEYIGVRIYPKFYGSQVGGENLIKQDIAADLIGLVVFDFPRGVHNIKPADTIQWNKTNEQLYDIGLSNMRMRYKSEVLAEDLNGSKVYIIQGDHFFVANAVLEMHLQNIPAGAQGYLVGIPHRHAVLIYPINDLELVKAINTLIYVIQGMYKDGPGSISQSLYWHRDGQLINLPYELTEKELKFFPPEEFLNMLNQLEAKK